MNGKRNSLDPECSNRLLENSFVPHRERSIDVLEKFEKTLSLKAELLQKQPFHRAQKQQIL